MQITEEEMAVYKETARWRWAHKLQQLVQRRKQARILARQAADLLREQFGANRVVMFGSLARPDLFHPQSDVDIAVWGLDERRYYRAVAQLLTLDPTIGIDLVMVQDAPVSLRAIIDQEGVVV